MKTHTANFLLIIATWTSHDYMELIKPELLLVPNVINLLPPVIKHVYHPLTLLLEQILSGLPSNYNLNLTTSP